MKAILHRKYLMETKNIDKLIENSPFLVGVSNLVKDNLHTYKIINRITSDYRGEVGITSAYNGRQLLELLQNADDEGTDEVLIELDSKEQTLTISNNGKAFSLEGIASLMVANNSVKKGRKKNFIGNKGLGFRSVLNWTNSIEIITKEAILKFSPLIAKKQFEQIVPDEALRTKLINQEKPLQDYVPFAVLAIPEVYPTEHKDSEWQTTIKLNYKHGAEQDILAQLAALKPEVLLFLNHIKKIKYSVNGNETLIEKKYPHANDPAVVVINDHTWNIKDSGERKADQLEDKHYQIKIAWKEDLSDYDTHFFTYFPTQVKTHLPCLIHASFELDPTRNQINPIQENRLVLEGVADVLCELATNELQISGHSDWRAFRLLTPKGTAENMLLKQHVHETLSEKKKELAIYPCVDGKYRTRDTVIFYSNDFSTWIKENAFETYFPEVLLAMDDDVNIPGDMFPYTYSFEAFKGGISKISRALGKNKVDQRAKLIAILLNEKFKAYHEPVTSVTFPLLIDTNGDVISEKKRVFTLKKGSIESLSIPDFVNISFIDVSLRESLELILKEELEEKKQEGETDYSRALKKLLSPIVNIGSNDITDVISTVISETNELTTSTSSFNDDLSKSLRSLYRIFNQNKERENVLVSKIVLLNKNGGKVKSNDLFLSRFYPSGKLTEELFDGVYKPENYLAAPADLGFGSEENSETIESFFLWLGVNKHIILRPIEFTKGARESNDYLDFVFPEAETRPKHVTRYYFEGLEIDNLKETFKTISPEKLILLVLKDGRLKQKIEPTHGDHLEYQYGQSYNTITCQSYIQYQLQSLYDFNEFLLDDHGIPFLNKFQFKFDSDFFKKHGVKQQDSNYVLSKLGAKISFNELRLEVVYQLIRNCKANDAHFEYGRKLYLSAFNYFKTMEDADFSTFEKDYYLLAEKNGSKDYRPASEVYYSDNNTLPSQILNQYWIFDFPKRSGEEQLAKYFGIQRIDSIPFTIDKRSIVSHASTQEFNAWLQKIKPYIFTHRLHAIKTEELKKANLSSIKHVEIELVSALNYSIDNVNQKQLLPGEYLKAGTGHFVLCGEHGSSLESLKESPEFCEAFSEIMCSLFMVSEGKDDYRAIFRDKNSLKDSQYLIKSKSLDPKLKEARVLFGVSAQEYDFWRTILELKGKSISQDITHETDLIQNLTLNFDPEFELPPYYSKVDFENFNNTESYEFLTWICNVTKTDLLLIEQKIPNFPGLIDWHLAQFKNTTYILDELFGKAVWILLHQKDASSQAQFHSIRKTYKAYIDETIHKLSTENAFVFGVNYKKLLIDNLNSHYGIAINDENIKDLSVRNQYDVLLKEFNTAITDLPDEIQSLLCFKGHDIRIKAFLEKLKTETEDENASESDIHDETLPIITTPLNGKHAPLLRGKKSKLSPPSPHSHKKEKQQKKAGKRAEKLVFNSLKKEFHEGRIQWISGNSEQSEIPMDDSLGYDMRYTKDDSENWFFLEVKSVSNDSFIISAHEVFIAFQNKDRYHLGLVKDDQIYIVENFFDTDEWRDNFELVQVASSIRPIDFEVFFELPDTINTGSEIEN